MRAEGEAISDEITSSFASLSPRNDSLWPYKTGFTECLRKELWKAPFEIIRQVELAKFKGLTTLTSLLEIRFLMRRKKHATAETINSDITKIETLFEIIIPDEICLLRANKLQMKFPLDPFDAITFATVLSIGSATLISRDKTLLKIASKLIDAYTPEEFLSKAEQ